MPCHTFRTAPQPLLLLPRRLICPRSALQAETTDCIHKLAATTFVQAVEGGPLSIIVPLLVRGLRERATAIKRKAAVIIDNMAKLVENPHDAAPFLPKLLPELEKVRGLRGRSIHASVPAGVHAGN